MMALYGTKHDGSLRKYCFNCGKYLFYSMVFIKYSTV
jgi:hypothetical protein